MWNVKKVNVSKGYIHITAAFQNASNDSAKRNRQLVVFTIAGSLSFAQSVMISHSGFRLLTMRGTVRAKQNQRPKY